MKHKIADDVNVNINHEFVKEDVEDVIDRVTASVLIIIATHTVASILRKHL